MTETKNRTIQPTDFSRPDAVNQRTGLNLSPLKLSLIAVFLLLALVALFMFQARAVKFVPEPIDSNIDIQSGLLTYRLGERILMLEGEFEITATAEGYETLTKTISVSSAPDQDIPILLTKLPGIVSFSAVFGNDSILGAEVFIDQESQGVTPITLDDVPAGLREVLIRHPRFRAFQTEFDVDGMQREQSLAADLRPAWADIEVSSTPTNADILVNEIVVAKTPASVEVIEGTHSLKVRGKGYKIYETQLSVIAEETQTLDLITLIKSDGKLNVISEPTGVNITVSGQYYGQTPLSITLPPSERYEILATKAGYENIRRNLQIKPEEDQSLNFRLKPIVGIIKLSVKPTGAELFVNNKLIGDANRTLELIAKNHDVRIELPGYATYETKILPQPGLSQQLNIVMQTEEAARVSAIPQSIATTQGDTLRFIIPGRLNMGAGRREPGRRSNEIEKDVTLTRAFYLGIHEISNDHFQAFDPGHNSGLLGRALLSDPERPAVNMTWARAVEYCNWLSRKDGLPSAYEKIEGAWRLVAPYTIGYRLPTEAEWAWASRYASGIKGSRFPWGDSMPPSAGAGNFADVSAESMTTYHIKNYNDSFRGPAPSGSFAANELGIYDLAGNVSEWIHDYYSVELARQPLTDPVGPGRGDYRVIRGANYTQGRFSTLRWTYRDYGAEARPDVGFRIARFVE
ncbi:MAG: sulfatase activating formylglycine-generating enzyme [Candidatus Azotimanducaceae bacterium]|jgi:formylglycine-generating enzyme required for sulfatase activity